MLEIKNLSVRGKNDVQILKDISLILEPSGCIGLTGASGSGKTTLIKVIMGMYGSDLIIDCGEVLLNGDKLLMKSAKERRLLCGKTFGFIPQNPMTAFFQHAKIGKQITETFMLHLSLNKKAATHLAKEVLEQVNLTDTQRVLSSYPGQLSGGMLQRVAMAIILGTKPQYILADEPTSALDGMNRKQIVQLLSKYKDGGILFLSHDVGCLKSLCSITHVIDSGKIIETQPTMQLFTAPKEAWTQYFVEVANKHEEVNWKWTALS